MEAEMEAEMELGVEVEVEEEGLGVIKDVTIGLSNSLLAMVRDNHL